MTNNKKKYSSYEDHLLEELQDPKLALAYLNQALTDDDQRVFLLALKDVLTAHKNDMTALAKEAKINRQNLYKMLSPTGNPKWDKINILISTLGYQLRIDKIR